jgi:hypothetical protein
VTTTLDLDTGRDVGAGGSSGGGADGATLVGGGGEVRGAVVGAVRSVRLLASGDGGEAKLSGDRLERSIDFPLAILVVFVEEEVGVVLQLRGEVASTRSEVCETRGLVLNARQSLVRKKIDVSRESGKQREANEVRMDVRDQHDNDHIGGARHGS